MAVGEWLAGMIAPPVAGKAAREIPSTDGRRTPWPSPQNNV